MLKSLIGILALSLFIPGIYISDGVSQPEDCRLLRFPDIYEDKIVFVYGGDLWLASEEGGVARQLTTYPGYESYPKFSPDGGYIAFTGWYDGNMDVYLIPAEGGEPCRLTYHPTPDMVIDWYPDGKHVLFRSVRTSCSSRFEKLFSVSIDGGLPKELPLPEAGLASLSPDGSQVAYNHIFRESSTWKRYQGGMAQDIWVYDFDANSIDQITNWTGTDSSPMWSGDRIYFTSDREHTLNIFSYNLTTTETHKITNHTEYDVKWPSLGPRTIIYENGGDLYVLDLDSERTKPLLIQVPSDRTLTRPYYDNVADFIENVGISPSGKRALFEARGDVFTVPAEKGPTRDLTKTPGVREIYPAWSPDGRWISYLSDRTGEYELYIRSQDGKGEEIRITEDGDCYRFGPTWSPDSQRLLYSDAKLRLWHVDIDEKQPVLVDTSIVGPIYEYTWSPDGEWVAYVKYASNSYFGSIYLYSLGDKEAHRVTDDFYDDFSPAFDSNGKYLYFLSARNFNPTFSYFEQTYVYLNPINAYVITLQADEPSPFAPQSDEEVITIDEEGINDDEETISTGEKPVSEETESINIDLDGIDQRVVGVPIPPGNYGNLIGAEDRFFYFSLPAILDYSTWGWQGEVHMCDVSERADYPILSGIDHYDLSADGGKLIYSSGGIYGIVAPSPGHQVGEGQLSTADMVMKLDPRAEWQQIFDEAWRLERDFFYDPNMHGVGWSEMKDRYGQLVPYVAHREDLNYVIGEMIGELGASHTYVGGGDMPKITRVNVGLMGADLEPSGGYYRFERIYRGEAGEAPLSGPGISVKEGEYLISVNGEEVHYPENPYRYFENAVGEQVTIEVNDKPTPVGAREVTIEPFSFWSDLGLRYIDWVETNRLKVDEATNGRVGYIHVPDTSVKGINEFSKAFFAQTGKEGLIIDVRYNAGGWGPEKFMEHLRRRPVGLWTQRGAQPVLDLWTTVPRGHMVCIINEYAGSGGDAFPYYFRAYGLGPLIGKRTWGGLIAIGGEPPLVDGGYVTCPSTAFVDMEGQLAVEGHGVDPDIEVDNRPDLVIDGQDPQLEAAIEEVLRAIEENPPILPELPPYSVKG